MKKKLLRWLYNYLQPKYSKEQKLKINRFKHHFRNYFEGCYDDYIGIDTILIKMFEITDFIFEFENKTLVATVVLCRPGLLIGKGGKTIDGLNTYMLKDNMVVRIKESKLWTNLNL